MQKATVAIEKRQGIKGYASLNGTGRVCILWFVSEFASWPLRSLAPHDESLLSQFLYEREYLF